MFDAIVVFVIGFMFIMASTFEDKDFIFKWIYLFAGITIVMLSVFNNYALTSTQSFLNGTTTYTYTQDNNLNWLGTGLSYFVLGMLFIFLYRSVQGLMISRNKKNLQVN